MCYMQSTVIKININLRTCPTYKNLKSLTNIINLVTNNGIKHISYEMYRPPLSFLFEAVTVDSSH